MPLAKAAMLRGADVTLVSGPLQHHAAAFCKGGTGRDREGYV